MKIISTNETMAIAGGSGQSQVQDGLLVATVEVPPHVQDQILEITLVLHNNTIFQNNQDNPLPFYKEMSN